MKKFIKLKNAIILSLVLSMVAPIQIPFNGTVVSAKTTSKTTTITMGEPKVSLEMGTSNYLLQLNNGKDIVKPTSKKPVKWKSSDSSIAKVSKFGRVSTVKEGTATITATYEGKSYKSIVTVIPKQEGTIRGELYEYTDYSNSFTPAINSYVYLIPKDIEIPVYSLKNIKKINYGTGKKDADSFRRILSSNTGEGNTGGGSKYTFSSVRKGNYIVLIIGVYTKGGTNKLTDEQLLLKHLGEENTKLIEDNIRNDRKYVIYEVTVETGSDLVYDYKFE
jgi:hypothetical protein